MRALLLAALTLALPACSGLEGLPPGFETLARATRSATPAILTLDHGRLLRAAVAVSERDLPPAVRHMIRVVQPDALAREFWREWGPRGRGYRARAEFAAGDLRTVLVDDAGRVLERSHTIAEDMVPSAVRDKLQHFGHLTRVEVVQGAPEEEYYRFTFAEGRTIETNLEGQELRSWIDLPARLQVAR